MILHHHHDQHTLGQSRYETQWNNFRTIPQHPALWDALTSKHETLPWNWGKSVENFHLISSPVYAVAWRWHGKCDIFKGCCNELRLTACEWMLSKYMQFMPHCQNSSKQISKQGRSRERVRGPKFIGPFSPNDSPWQIFTLTNYNTLLVISVIIFIKINIIIIIHYRLLHGQVQRNLLPGLLNPAIAWGFWEKCIFSFFR